MMWLTQDSAFVRPLAQGDPLAPQPSPKAPTTGLTSRL